MQARDCCAAALATTNVYQYTCTEHRAIDDRESLQNRGASGWKFLHVILLAH